MPLSSMWQISSEHWLVNARHCPSPFVNDRPLAEISLAVVHGISLPPGEFGGPYIDQLFLGDLDPKQHAYFAEIQGLEVSTHILIRRDGELVQYVPFNRRAWHAGRSTYRGRENCNDFSIGIELEGSDDVAYEAVQYEQLIALLRCLWQHYPQAQGNLVGHSDIAPGRKTDPGPCFQWDWVCHALDIESRHTIAAP